MSVGREPGAPPRCPNCRHRLDPASLDAQTAPWLCTECSRGWWQAELDAAKHWDPDLRDFGSQTARVLAAAEGELAQQLAREDGIV